MIAVFGTWDSKGDELEFLTTQIEALGRAMPRIDAGTRDGLRHRRDIGRRHYLPDADLTAAFGLPAMVRSTKPISPSFVRIPSSRSGIHNTPPTDESSI
jgi:uncharacterized protein (UPF0261 family)